MTMFVTHFVYNFLKHFVIFPCKLNLNRCVSRQEVYKLYPFGYSIFHNFNNKIYKQMYTVATYAMILLDLTPPTS